jgi:hypothetical protein
MATDKTPTNDKEQASKDALSQTADFVRFSSGLVTATLAFSFAFLSGPLAMSETARAFLYVSWVIFLISLLAALVVFGVIPPKFEDRDYSLHDAALNIPGVIHLGTYLLGLVFLAVGVAIASRPSGDALPTAQAATEKALQVLRKPSLILLSVDLINGVQSTKSSFTTWRVRLQAPAKGRSAATTLDVLLNANTGRYTVYHGARPGTK